MRRRRDRATRRRAPAGTPRPIVDKLNTLVREAVAAGIDVD